MGDPALAVDDVRGPAELLDGLKDAAREENGAFAVVAEELPVRVVEDLPAAEIVLVVDEIDLDAGGGNRRDLDDEGPVDVSDDDVHAGEADDFVELVFALVDAAVARHECPDFPFALLDALRQLAADLRDPGFRDIGEDLRIDEQDLFCRLSHITDNYSK